MNRRDLLESNFIKEQMFKLFDDGFKIKQNSSLLEERVFWVSNQIGYYSG
jgi:hypothetical protein